MDGQQYLDQISKPSIPGKAAVKKPPFWRNKFFIIGASCVAALILIMILGSTISGSKVSEKTLDYKLRLHLENTADVIKTYQNDVRSSDLRSSSASLYGVLTSTNSELETYLVEKYNFKKDKEINKKLQASAEEAKTELSDALFEAKINGILDRIYAHKMAYEISLIEAEESEIYEITKNESLKSLLGKYYDGLKNLYDKFNDFSETNN